MQIAVTKELLLSVNMHKYRIVFIKTYDMDVTAVRVTSCSWMNWRKNERKILFLRLGFRKLLAASV